LAQAVAALREDGPSLGRPLVDRLKGSRIHHLKELRPGSRGRSEIRIIFAFDPTRSALLLLGGDKAGNWERWYRDNVPVSIARISQIEHGDVTSFEVIARYVEALGGRLNLVADFGDRTVRLPVSDTAHAA
jgi:hypothetical protein